jgi:hypothetical protein
VVPPNGAAVGPNPVDELIMDDLAPTAGSVDRLAAEFPAMSRRDIEQVVAQAWALFRGSADDEVLRVVATEWFARTELEARSRLGGERAAG